MSGFSYPDPPFATHILSSLANLPINPCDLGKNPHVGTSRHVQPVDVG